MTTRLLLDTCAFVWAAIDTEALPQHVRSAVESPDNIVVVSAASVWEIATKTRLGKWPEAKPIAADVANVIRSLGFRDLPISVDHASRAGSLPGDHKDPFDRLIIAQAQAENLAVVTSDKIFDEYHVRRIW